MKFVVLVMGVLLLSANGRSQNIQSQLDSLFASRYQANAPGAAVIIESKGKILFSKSYGLANLESKTRIDTRSNFNIASLTKQFTAYCILKLADARQLSLDDKIARFFPDFNLVVANKITVRQLLTHSSGLLDHYGFTDTTRVRHANDHDVLDAVLHSDHTYFEPGTQYRYSNTAYCLLALIIEKLSGRSYADYVRENIFLPLGMTHSRVLAPGGDIWHQVTGYDTASNPARFTRLDFDESIFFSTEGDGGVYTSVQDYLRWFHALQQTNGGVLSHALVNQARKAQVTIDKEKGLSYGFGWFINDKTQPVSVYHSGSNGGFRTMVFTIPSARYAVIIFSNRTDIDLETLVEQVNAVLHIDVKSFTKINSFVSFNDCWPNFAPCKETPSYLTSFNRNLNASAMASN